MSSVDAAHTHTLCVVTSDLTNPPASGRTYTTSIDGGHSHTVTLSQADLTAINHGETVTVTSSNDIDPTINLAHTHGFMMAKTTAGSGDTPPSGW